LRAIRSARTRQIQRFSPKNQSNLDPNDLKMNGITRKIRESTVWELRAERCIQVLATSRLRHGASPHALAASQHGVLKKPAITACSLRGGQFRFRQEPFATQLPVKQTMRGRNIYFKQKTRAHAFLRSKIARMSPRGTALVQDRKQPNDSRNENRDGTRKI